MQIIMGKNCYWNVANYYGSLEKADQLMNMKQIPNAIFLIIDLFQ